PAAAPAGSAARFTARSSSARAAASSRSSAGGLASAAIAPPASSSDRDVARRVRASGVMSASGRCGAGRGRSIDHDQRGVVDRALGLQPAAVALEAGERAQAVHALLPEGLALLARQAGLPQ